MAVLSAAGMGLRRQTLVWMEGVLAESGGLVAGTARVDLAV